MTLANKAFSIFQRDLLLFVTRLATGIAVARMLGPEVLGIWVILSLVPTYAEALGRTKADAAGVYFIGQKIFRREDVLFNLNVIAIVSAVIIVSLILFQFDALYGFLFKNESGNFVVELRALLILIPLQFFYLNYSYFHISSENTYTYNRMVVIHAWVNSIISIALLTLTPLSIWAVILGSITGTGLALLYGWYRIDRSSWIAGHLNLRTCLTMLQYAFHLYLSALLVNFRESGTRLIAVSFLSPAQLAFLGQGQGVGKLLHKVTDALNTILYPRFSNSSSKDAHTTAAFSFRISSILLIAGGLALAVIVEPLVVLLYGKPFQPSAEVVYYLLPGLVIGGVSGTLSAYFAGTGQAKLLPRILFIPVALQLVIAWLFLKWWGLAGAAVALSLGLAIYGLTLIVLFIRVSHTPFSALVPGRADFQYLFRFGLLIFAKSIFERFIKKGN